MIDFRKFLEAMMGSSINDANVIERGGAQVGKLTTKDAGRRRKWLAEVTEMEREVDLMQTKILAITTDLDAKRKEFWNGILKNYGLPSGRKYYLHDDGRIFMMPKDKDE